MAIVSHLSHACFLTSRSLSYQIILRQILRLLIWLCVTFPGATYCSQRCISGGGGGGGGGGSSRKNYMHMQKVVYELLVFHLEVMFMLISQENRRRKLKQQQQQINRKNNNAVVCSVEYSELGRSSVVSGSNVITDELKRNARIVLSFCDECTQPCICRTPPLPRLLLLCQRA
jgi:hypothetical protein